MSISSFALRALGAALDRGPRGIESRATIYQQLEIWLGQKQGKHYGWDTPREEARAILHLLPTRGCTVFDVGAQHGEWSREVMAGADGQIKKLIAFDPDPANAKYLTSIANCTFVPMALSAHSGSAELFTEWPGSGRSSLHQNDSHHGDTLVITTTTIDEYCAEQGIDRIDFLKMDVEGHELAVLRGAERMLADDAIRALSFEFGGCNVASRTFFRDFWQMLTPLGFRFWRILPGAKLLPIRQYNELLEHFTIANYVATRWHQHHG